jgi:hypothetical protein
VCCCNTARHLSCSWRPACATWVYVSHPHQVHALPDMYIKLPADRQQACITHQCTPQCTPTSEHHDADHPLRLAQRGSPQQQVCGVKGVGLRGSAKVLQHADTHTCSHTCPGVTTKPCTSNYQPWPEELCFPCAHMCSASWEVQHQRSLLDAQPGPIHAAGCISRLDMHAAAGCISRLDMHAAAGCISRLDMHAAAGCISSPTTPFCSNLAISSATYA